MPENRNTYAGAPQYDKSAREGHSGASAQAEGRSVMGGGGGSPIDTGKGDQGAPWSKTQKGEFKSNDSYKM